MRRSVSAQQQLHETINEDIDKRTQIHQSRISRIKTTRRSLTETGVPLAPLVLLAHGDSWFDYPLSGNGLSLDDTDVIAQLRTMGTINPLILNVSHHGDASTDELSWPKQQRLIDALQDPANWLESGKPDAILFSAGGNDIAGNQFCIFLDFAKPGSAGLNSERFQKALGMVEASYLDLLQFRDKYAPGVPIFGHSYDFAIPNGRHPDCVGPWLKPSLDFNGWHELAQASNIVKQALTDFKNMLQKLVANSSNNFTLVDTQGTLSPEDWANELHPFPQGFKKIASKFVTALQAHSSFHGRI